MMVGSIEIVRNSYMPKILGSQFLGDVLGVARNVATDLIDTSEYLKYNFQNYASGNFLHPTEYEWEAK